MSEAQPARAPRPSEPWLSTVLRVLVHALTACVVAWPLTVTEGVVAAGVGGAAGSLMARGFGLSRLRLTTVFGLGLGGFGLLWLARWFVVDLTVVPEALGPAGALLIGDVVVFGLGALVVSAMLRTLSIRRPAMTILEAALIAGSFATLLVAHRNGAIHRPYELADPLIEQNYDPTLAILAVGVLGAAVIGLLLLSEKNLLRWAFHVLVVLVVLFFVFLTPTTQGLPTPIDRGGAALGLRDDESRRERDAEGQHRQADSLDFLDDYPSGGGSTVDGVVIFHDDYSPESETYYFRQTAFSQFNGRKLIAAGMAGVNNDVGNLFPTNRAVEVDWVPPPDDRVEVATTVGLIQDNSAPIGLEAPQRFVPATNPAPERFRRVYRVESYATDAGMIELLDRPAGDPTWSDEVLAHYLEAPDDPRYGEMAQTIVSNLPSDLMNQPIAQAAAISQYLSEHGIYSLQSRHAGAADPTADFLFGDLTGYCVHFAHAAAFLMRKVGLPARVATGYAVAESTRAGGSAVLLMNSDQHAWPEVYIEGAGWVVVDVYPQTVLSQAGGMTDSELQQLLAEMLRGAHALDDAPSPPIPVGQIVRSWGPAATFALTTVLPAIVVALLLLGYAIKLYRRGLFGLSPRMIYRAALDRLAEGGIRREWGESPEAFAARVRDTLPALSPLTERHLSAAFGGRDHTTLTDAMLRDARRLETELRGVVPAWRAMLGLANPYSWVLTR